MSACARRLDARDLHVAGQRFLAHADRKYRHALRLETGDRLVDAFAPRCRSRRSRARGPPPAGRSVRCAPDRAHRRAGCRCPSNFRSAVDCSRSADDENRKMRRLNRSPSAVSSGASGRPSSSSDERAARLAAIVIGHLHAARVVEQDADEVLLRDGHLQQQHGPQQTRTSTTRNSPMRMPRGASRAGASGAPRSGDRSTGRTPPRRRPRSPSATLNGWRRR